MSVTNTVSALNGMLRSIFGLATLAVISVGGWLGYEKLNQSERLGEVREKLTHVTQQLEEERLASQGLRVELAESLEKIEKLDTALHLLKVDHRLAEINVLRQTPDPETGRMITDIEFVEISEQGHRIGRPKQFTLEGDKVYVDYWVVKFDDSYVEQSELNRATSICLFRGIHGEFQSPAEAYRLDTVGSRPAAYERGTPMSEFEKAIWNDFWDIANDPERAREKGIRAAHGEEPYTQVRAGMTYRLELRASGGLSITPTGNPARSAPTKATSGQTRPRKPFSPRRLP